VSSFRDPEIEISVRDAAKLLEDGEAVLVDVREPHEWDAGRIPGARHVQLEHLAAQAESIPRDTQVIFQCRLGIRSAMATKAFRASGYDALSMAGGIQAWNEAGLPMDPPDGRVADH
jgi:hydroxyacylglutathione hydrolase/adenylyltransferase/sulfurtransferase